MELMEMKQAWLALDRQLAEQRTLNAQLFRESRLDRLRRGLRPLVWGQSLQILFGIALATWAVTFWLPHRSTLHLLVSGLLMQGFGLLMIISGARVLELVRRIDHGAAVATIQRQLADLRRWRVRVEFPVNAIVGSFIWIPMLIMNLAMYGLDPWGAGLLSWAVSSAMVGLGVVMLVILFARRLGYGARLEAHAAGSSVQRAKQALDELERFVGD